jgi:PIN domain nuclease of toxin-antitoxin system
MGARTPQNDQFDGRSPEASVTAALPWHHRDPFDRLIAAQALDAGYTLVTRDIFVQYGVAVVRA